MSGILLPISGILSFWFPTHSQTTCWTCQSQKRCLNFLRWFFGWFRIGFDIPPVTCFFLTDRLCSMLRCSGPLTWPRLAWRRRSALCKRDSWCSWAKVTLGFRNFSQDFYTRKKTAQTYANIVYSMQRKQYRLIDSVYVSWIWTRFGRTTRNWTLDWSWKGKTLRLPCSHQLHNERVHQSLTSKNFVDMIRHQPGRSVFFLCFASDKKIIKTCSRNTYHIYIYIQYIYIHIELKY